MYVLSIISFLLLAGFLLLAAMRFGVPDMVSDVYYQLQNCAGSEVIGDKRKRNYGWVFTVVMVTCAILMLIPLLDSGKGVQFLAFLGCGGLMFVGAAPNYLDADDYPIHKVGALVAAAGCVGWCLSVCWSLTLIVACLYAFAMIKVYDRNIFIGFKVVSYHPWYWLEVSAFLDVFVTYWIIY